MLTAITLAACGGAAAIEIRVSAASSLTDVFGDLEFAFEERNPGVDLTLNLGSSSRLREQILAGAPADVFASADAGNMSILETQGWIEDEPEVFARNRMAIAVPVGNPAGVVGLEDFSREDLFLGVCAEGVPCGELARAVLSAAGVRLASHSSEPNVRSLLTKTAAGELDAGIVYVTDVVANEDVEGLPISDDVNQITEYPAAVVSGTEHPAEARLFVEFLLSNDGRRILSEYGFVQP